jgi:phospholipid transport system substrate-binding protein
MLSSCSGWPPFMARPQVPALLSKPSMIKLSSTQTRRWTLMLMLGASSWLASPSWAANASTPDGLIRELATETLETVKADKAIQAGDMARILALVDAKVMPHVDFKRLTSSAVGRFWRQATPEQQEALQREFRTLLLRTYAGALSQVKDHQLAMRPLRAAPEDTEVVVRTQVRGKGEPIQLDYRLAKVGAIWQIYDVNVLGIWLGDQYRSSFAEEINKNGIAGLIKTLTERNAKAAGK